MKKLVLVAALFVGVHICATAEANVSAQCDVTLTVEENRCPICGGHKPQQKSEVTLEESQSHDEAQKCSCGKPPKQTRDNQE